MDGDKKQAVKSEEAGGWQYKPAAGAPAPVVGMAEEASQSSDDTGSIEWTASEFVAHDKSFSWYSLLAMGVIVIAAALYLVTRDVFSAVVVLVIGVVLGVAGSRKPKVITYRLDGSGLTAGTKFYAYSDYKCFTMPEEGPFASIVLMPMKRFGIPVSAYLAPDSQQEVLKVLSSYLPLEKGQMGGIDRIMRELRF